MNHEWKQQAVVKNHQNHHCLSSSPKSPAPYMLFVRRATGPVRLLCADLESIRFFLIWVPIEMWNGSEQMLRTKIQQGRGTCSKIDLRFELNLTVVFTKMDTQHKKRTKQLEIRFKRRGKFFLTLTKPVRRSRFKCKFFISPNSPKASCRWSSCASSCTPLTKIIHPSTAVNIWNNYHHSQVSEQKENYFFKQMTRDIS